MDDFFDDNEDGADIDELVSRFEQMAKGKDFFFFDTEEYEDLIDYFLMRNNLKKVKLVLKYALEQYPYDIRLRVKLAHYYLRNNRIDNAFDILRKAEDDAPENPDVLMAKALAFSTIRNHKKAIEEYGKALNCTDDHYPILLNMSHEYEMLEDYNSAIDCVVKILRMDPENTGALYELSYLITASMSFEKGVLIFNEFLDENPYSAVAWVNLGLVYFNLELFEKAVDALDFAIAIDPEYGEAYYHKAIALMSTDDFDTALELLLNSPAYHLDPDAVKLATAECYEKTGDIQNAISTYLELVGNESFKQAAYVGLSICYEHLNKLDTALTYARSAYEIQTDNTEAIFTLASLLQKLGYTEEAINVFKGVADDLTNDPDYFQEFAITYAADGRYEDALDVLNKALIFHAKNLEIIYQRIAYLLLCGKRSEAFEALLVNFLYTPLDSEILFEYGPALKNDMELLKFIEQLKN
jgi:tetratricopeptide (TPR) repeat protein